MEMNKKHMKRVACEAIDAHADEIIALGEDILRHPELGYSERRTAKAMAGQLTTAGVEGLTGCAATGLKGWQYGAGHHARLALIAELDAVVSPRHPFADPQTHAAHACGHNAQLAALLGCAHGIKAVRQQLDGDVCFLCAPSEEYIELGHRNALREAGHIRWFGGKQQLICEGALDDIDLAMMVHGDNALGKPHISTGSGSLGFIGKMVRFTGVEAHAGAAPWEGVNALNAASLALQAIHAIRESFPDGEHIRVHPIITKGGDSVNTVPADVHMECYVRAISLEALRRANSRVDRAIRGAAWAVGAQADITNLPGYMPLHQNAAMGALFAQNAAGLLPGAEIRENGPLLGSTDMGDISWILPAIHPEVNGFSGGFHAADFTVADPMLAYVVPSKLMTMTAIDLLWDGAEAALEVCAGTVRKTPDEHAGVWNGVLGAEEGSPGPP